MDQEMSSISTALQGSETMAGDRGEELLDLQVVARMANDLYQEVAAFHRETGNVTADPKSNRDLVGRVPGSETDVRAEMLPPETGSSDALLKHASPLAFTPPAVDPLLLDGSNMAQVAAAQVKSAETLPKAMHAFLDLFPEIPASSKVSFQHLENLQEPYFLPGNSPSPVSPSRPTRAAQVQDPGLGPGRHENALPAVRPQEFSLQDPFAQGFLNIPSPHQARDAQRYYFLPELHQPAEASAPSIPPTMGLFDVQAVRRDFPVLQQTVHGKPLAWLDNAATTQKPQSVIDAVASFYEEYNSNIHRGAHELAARATDAYEDARKKVQLFIGAASSQEIVFVRGATEAINLVAQSYGRKLVGSGDEILLTEMEHHANIVPWQILCEETGAVLRVAPVNDLGEVMLDRYGELLGPRTKLVALTQVSNALGTVNPVEIMVKMARMTGARILVDGAQSIPHFPIDVQAMDCDFFVFSGHKLFGPTGIGALYGKRDLLESMPPWQGGGSMISDVTFEKTVYNTVPHRFEAGTGSIASAIGLGAAIDYMTRVGMHTAARYEEQLLVYATEALAGIAGLRLIGTAPSKVSVLSFVLDGVSNEEVGKAMDREGIAVRAGHHCAQPVLRRFGLESTVRPSLAFYNTFEEIDRLVEAILKIRAG